MKVILIITVMMFAVLAAMVWPAGVITGFADKNS
jgi:hypothetical protein